MKITALFALLLLSACSLVLDFDSLEGGDGGVARDASEDARPVDGAADADGRDGGSDGGDLDGGDLDGGDLDGGVDSGPVFCANDDECDDGAFCNGEETCDPSDGTADSFGCVAGDRPCDDLCDDDADACVMTCPGGGVPVLGTCRATCETAATCGLGEVCIEGACLPSAEACGACVGGACAAGTVCRPSLGPCDVPDVCNGTSTTCEDGKRGAETVCRASSAACDAPEACDGVSPLCPDDRARPAGTTCRPAAGPCDVADVCNGTALTCPTDGFAPATTVCRAAMGTCDVAERCTGASAACPADALATIGTTCRASAGACDLAEVCSGASADCPSDTVRAAGFVCRGTAGVCDVEETCNGTSGVCPADGFRPSTTVCRAGSGDVCDPDERCTGVSAGCPTNMVAPSSFVCRAGANACDPEERCTGTAGATCPADVDALSCPGATSCVGGVCRLPEGRPIVFVSSNTRRNDTSLAGTDAMCQARATAAHLGGRYVAIMSDASTNAIDRVVDRAYFRVDDVKVVDSRADMFDSSVDATISVDENGSTITVFPSVATGTLPDGTVSSRNCLNWTSVDNVNSPDFGQVTRSDGGWVYTGGTGGCGGQLRYYCIQAD
ncbi:MAG: hypothetical protein H6724_02140 [Sandaracinus sp.]|nr:hypothetical protein [Sandaracinus sp.]MCB9625201.1 hypothetical protein [Sandaracinus sp.]